MENLPNSNKNLFKDFVSSCCSSTMSEVKNGGVSPFKCNHCGKRCQPKQLKNQGLEINKLGIKKVSWNADLLLWDDLRYLLPLIKFEMPECRLEIEYF